MALVVTHQVLPCITDASSNGSGFAAAQLLLYYLGYMFINKVVLSRSVAVQEERWRRPHFLRSTFS